jgi:hypothetical protein
MTFALDTELEHQPLSPESPRTRGGVGLREPATRPWIHNLSFTSPVKVSTRSRKRRRRKPCYNRRLRFRL